MTPGMPSLAWGRIFFLYGPFEHPKRLIPSVAQALLKGQEAHAPMGDSGETSCTVLMRPRHLRPSSIVTSKAL